MAKRRTKKDKQKAKHQAVATLKAKNNGAKVAKPSNSVKSLKTASAGAKNKEIFDYDPQLIYQDLRKTLVVSIVVLLVLALISLRYT